MKILSTRIVKLSGKPKEKEEKRGTPEEEKEEREIDKERERNKAGEEKRRNERVRNHLSARSASVSALFPHRIFFTRRQYLSPTHTTFLYISTTKR